MDFYFFWFCTYKLRLLFCMVIVLMVVVGFYWSYICLTVRFSLNWYARRCAIDVWPRCIFVICLQSVVFQHDCRGNAVIVWDYWLRMLSFVGLDPSLLFCQEQWEWGEACYCFRHWIFVRVISLCSNAEGASPRLMAKEFATIRKNTAEDSWQKNISAIFFLSACPSVYQTSSTCF